MWYTRLCRTRNNFDINGKLAYAYIAVMRYILFRRCLLCFDYEKMLIPRKIIVLSLPKQQINEFRS